MRSTLSLKNIPPAQPDRMPIPVVPAQRGSCVQGRRLQTERPRAPTNVGRPDDTSLAAPLRMRLSQFLTLTPEEVVILNELQAGHYAVPRNHDVIVQGYKYRNVFVLNRGVVIRYKVMHDGRRQIVNFVLPGELIGFPACLFDTALYTLSTLTDAVVAPVTFDGIRTLFCRSPRLGAAMFWQSAREAAMYVEHVVDIGRRSAYERVAHLLLELLCRLQIIGMGDARSFDLPLTQELIADVLGLSMVHVNRTFRRLREAGLVIVEGHRFVIKDLESLAQLADFESSYLARDRIPGLPYSN